MNKLIIIGNGFDLAHGLPTSYKHFIDRFWEDLRLNYKEDHIKELVYVNENNFNYLDESIKNFSNILSSLEEYSDTNNYQFDNENYTCKSYSSTGIIIFEFRNNFFKKINKKSIINWVDIENEYYQELKIKSKIKKADSIENDNNKEYSNSIKILNDEFEQIRSLFENYLMEHVTKKFYFDKDPSKANSLLNFIKEEPKRYSESNSHKSCLDEFPKEDELELKEFDNKFYEAYNNREVKKFIEDNKCYNIFLNFNYTHSIDQYCDIIKKSTSVLNENYFTTKMIQIHGRLNDRNNQMNFGFGDEMDTDYKFIENLDDNGYLKNFKSFKYLQNSNYKQLIDFIDSSKFQVYIMGHSCGLSDRTMLNTIFEHNNCRSIKVFYYEWKNENEEINDNYTELIQNISRHFNDKKMMRSKIVNKSLCDALPQDIRFINKTTHE